MQRKIMKFLSLMLALLLCMGVLGACQHHDPLAETGFASLTIDDKGRINATLTVNARALAEREGERVYFYEVLPGESLASAVAREPLDEARVDSEVRFRCSLDDESGRSRLYSSFCVLFEDGTPVVDDGFYVENPQLLASNRSVFAWDASPKALVGADLGDAASMNVAHVMYEIKLSELMGGADSFIYHGQTYAISPDALASLDKQIASATDAGMQVSLCILPDSLPSAMGFAAIADLLCARYAGGENGLVSALFLKTVNVDDMPTMCRIASLALRSRVANGRVYAVAPSMGLSETLAFFEQLRLRFCDSGELDWGAAVIPQASDAAPWEDVGENAVSPANLGKLSDALYSSNADGRISYFALCDVAYDAADPDRQAVSYAYTYFSAVAAHAGLVFYRDYLNEATGLRSESGEGRRILSVIADIDTGLSLADRRLCEQLAKDAWQALGDTEVSRLLVSGTAHAGPTGMDEEILFDFCEGDTLGFIGLGALTAPEMHDSAVWGRPVLYTWINPAYDYAGGVRRVISDASVLEGATSLSVQLLTQVPEDAECRMRLSLEGMTAEGQRLTYENSVDIAGGTWQTVTFGISSFATEMDPSRPCVLTVSTEPLSEADEDFVLWVRGINLRHPERDMGALQAVLIVLSCVTVGFLIVFLFYRRTAKSHPRRRR